MKKDLVARIALALALSLLILLSIMLISYWQTGRLSEYERKENLTFDIIQGLDRLVTDVREVRTEQREFSRSGEARYFQSYREELQKVQLDLKAFDELKRDAPWLEQRLRVIRGLVQEKLAESAQGMLALEQGSGDHQGTGRLPFRLGEIRREASAAQAEAVALMRRLSASQSAQFKNVQRLLAANSIAIIFLVSVVFRLLSTEIRRRMESERELMLHRDQLDELVTVRTGELLQANRDLTAEIEERQRVEAALYEKERTYRSLFENSLDAVLMVASDGSVAAANQAASDLFGMTPGELGNCRREQLVAAELAAGKGEGQPLFEAMLRRKDGTLFPAELGSAVVADGAGSFLIIHDLSERKWAEQVQHNLSEHEQNIQEQERLALSRELHDEIGQNLTALKLDLSWIERRIGAPAPELAGRLKEMREGLDQLIVKTQGITAALRPPLLDNLGLAAAIEWQAGEFTRRSGIRCHLMLDEEAEVDSPQSATMVLRIFQEALTNILRHAGAAEVGISLCRRGSEILLEICDDGRGITVADLNSPSAFGIMGMRERARLCRGNLSLQGSPGEGTTVVLTIPAAEGGSRT